MEHCLVDVAQNQIPAQLILRNAKIVDVFTGSIYPADIAIANGKIAGIGHYETGETVIDLQGRYVSPGLINAHCHVESSMAAPGYYCMEELRWGVTTLITDPHEIANVAGTAGIRYMLDATRDLPINYYVQMPSCVPATPFEHAGCVLDAEQMREIADEPGVLGLGEVMNVPGVLSHDQAVCEKLDLFAGRPIDGHAPGLTGEALQAYAAAGIQTDHESSTWEEARAKLRAGIAVLVREGSACRNLQAIIEGVVADGASVSRMAFCTDDKHLADIHREGTIRWCVKQAIACGLPAMSALQMATIHAAQIYGLSRVGAIAPGWWADLVVWEDLESWMPHRVYHHGMPVDPDGEISVQHPTQALRESVHVGALPAQPFALPRYPDDMQPVMEMVPHEILTNTAWMAQAEVPQALAQGTLCKIAVLERHHATGNIGVGLIRGYGLQDGAIATTVAHDSHNMIVVGTNDADMLAAVQELTRVQGGYTIVRQGKVVDTLPLPICGLMSEDTPDHLTVRLEELSQKAHEMGVSETADPFITLSFMALPVIPSLRITDMGMFDVERFQFVERAE